MYCTNCGKENSIDSKFCTNCGKKLQTNKNKTCTLRVHRQGQLMGGLWGIDVFIDGKQIGEVYVNGMVEAKVEPGVHEIALGNWIDIINRHKITVEDDDSEVYIDIKMKLALASGGAYEIVDIKRKKYGKS